MIDGWRGRISRVPGGMGAGIFLVATPQGINPPGLIGFLRLRLGEQAGLTKGVIRISWSRQGL